MIRRSAYSSDIVRAPFRLRSAKSWSDPYYLDIWRVIEPAAPRPLQFVLRNPRVRHGIVVHGSTRHHKRRHPSGVSFTNARSANMSWIVAIIIGGIVGWLASIIMKT